MTGVQTCALPIFINLVGGNSITTAGAGNTVTVKNLADTTKYVVDPIAGETAYTTIQSALDAANIAAIPALVYIRAGTITENLTLYDNIPIQGATDYTSIIGTHTPPATGTFTFDSLILQSATDIFNSAVAGTASLNVNNSFIIITNGYVFNLPNWTGELLMDNCGEASTNDGVVNNTGGSEVKFLNVEIGAGNRNTMTLTGNGNLRFDTVNINCPVNIGGTGTLVFQQSVKCAESVTIGGAKVTTVTMGNLFENTLTTAGTATVNIANSIFKTGANQSITHNSASTLTLSTSSIDSSNNPAVGGTGTIDVTGVDFVDNALFADRKSVV